MNGKGRPEKLTGELKEWVVKHQQGRKKKLKATAILTDMRAYIENKLRQQNNERELPWTESLLQSEVEGRMPGLSAIQKFLKPVNEALDKPSELDNPWHLGLMTKPEYQHLSAEALFNIGFLQSFCRIYKEPPLYNPFPPLSVRQALWTARLYPYMSLWAKDKVKMKQTDWCCFQLYAWSKTYAEYERICNLANTPFDTTELDQKLQEGNYPMVVSVEGKKYQSLIFLSPDKVISQISVKEGGK